MLNLAYNVHLRPIAIVFIALYVFHSGPIICSYPLFLLLLSFLSSRYLISLEVTLGQGNCGGGSL
jgi:hypothetical protein